VSDARRAEPDFPALLGRARALDRDALGTLYDRYLPAVYRFVLARVGDPHLAEDLTADTFMAMVESIERARADDELSFAAWLFGVARNKVAEHLRRRATRGRLAPEVEMDATEPLALAEADDPLGVVIARERWAAVAAALRELTDEQRDVVLYRCMLGYDTDEVARLLGRQPGAVRALQFRALSALARRLSASGTDPMMTALRGTQQRPAPGRRSRRSDDATRS
jgi:RNA polymerase sigma-70 factor (ECF subfamily)